VSVGKPTTRASARQQQSETAAGTMTSEAASSSASVPNPPRPASHGDHAYAPSPFYGKSQEDAQDFLKYIERYADFKNMNEAERLQFIAVLLRDSASDFYDSLDDATRGSWDTFKTAFLGRFGRSEAVRWRDVGDIWSVQQQPGETSADYIAKITRRSRHLPSIDETTLRYAIIHGLRPEVRSYVLQSGAKTMAELLQAAQVADVAATPADPTLTTLLNEVRASGARLAAHDVEFELLRNKLGQLNVSTVSDTDQPRDRYSSTGRVRFDTRYRSPSPRPSENQARRSPAPPRPVNQRNSNGCYRCGKLHPYGRCPALNVQCLACGRIGHYRSVCRQGRKATTRHRQ